MLSVRPCDPTIKNGDIGTPICRFTKAKMNYSSTIFVISVALATTGCSTPGELRTEKSAVPFLSGKDAKVVSTCVLEGFESAIKMAGISSRPTANGFTVSINQGVAMGRDTAFLVDIENGAIGSATKVYSKVLVGEAKLMKVVSECQT